MSVIDREWPCLELTKTVGWEARDRSDDELTSYGALVSWAVGQEVLGAAHARSLLAAAKRRRDEAEGVLGEAVELRALLYRIFAAIGQGARPRPEDVQALNRILREVMGRLELVPAPDGYAWAWLEDEEDLHSVLWPVVRSAAELLTSGELDRVKLCGADDCGWLFVDASRNRSRRWCDMSDCGNRAKARRFRRRRRGEE